jgi:hypothetical protein
LFQLVIGITENCKKDSFPNYQKATAGWERLAADYYDDYDLHG